ncbi:hypothetical protein ACLB2K_028944 [Fragaria x ananassa]
MCKSGRCLKKKGQFRTFNSFLPLIFRSRLASCFSREHRPNVAGLERVPKHVFISCRTGFAKRSLNCVDLSLTPHLTHEPPMLRRFGALLIFSVSRGFSLFYCCRLFLFLDIGL